MQGNILITGATGNVGREVALILQQKGQPVRAAIVSKADVTALPDPTIPHEIFDFGDPDTYPAAFDGVDRLFLMRPPALADVDCFFKPVVDYATSHGVRHIVFLSLLGAEKNRLVPHAAIEKYLIQSPVSYTLLRCGFFMQNLSTTHARDVAEHDEIFVPAGAGKTAFVDVRDIAGVAVRALTEPGHENQAYPLTGSKALDYYEVAEIMSDALGRTIRYSNPSVLRFAWRFWRRGYPLRYVGVTSAIYLTTRFGLAQTVTPHLRDLLGCAPRTMREFAADYAASWQPTTPSANPSLVTAG